MAGDLGDRPLPAHLFRKMLDGELDAGQALEQAQEHYRRVPADFNDTLRAAFAGTSPDQRAQRFQATRDQRGRFAADQAAASPDGKAPATTMNDLLRERLANGQSTGGSLNLDLSHLSEGPKAA